MQVYTSARGDDRKGPDFGDVPFAEFDVCILRLACTAPATVCLAGAVRTSLPALSASRRDIVGVVADQFTLGAARKALTRVYTPTNFGRQWDWLCLRAHWQTRLHCITPPPSTIFTAMSVEDQTEQGPAIFDSLPYYDNDLERDPSLKEKAERLIAREMKPQQGLHPRVPPPITLFAVCVLYGAEIC